VLGREWCETRIRRRWGVERFRRIFQRTVQSCVAAGIAKGEIVHIDASLIRADVSWESLCVRYVEASADANGDAEDVAKEGRQTGKYKTGKYKAGKYKAGKYKAGKYKAGKYKKVCLTDPDATMATTARNRRLEPADKQHTAVDDEKGVILDVAVTTGEVNEGQILESQLEATMATTGVSITTVTAWPAMPMPRSTRRSSGAASTR